VYQGWIRRWDIHAYTQLCARRCGETSSNGSQARLDALFSAEPDRNRLRRRLNGETEPTIQPVNFSAFGASGSFDGRFSAALSQVSFYAANESGLANDPFAGVRHETQRTDIWVEGYLRRYWSDAANADRDGTLGIVYGGIDYTLTDDVLIGFLAQLDWGEETVGATNTTTDGVGWMAGPYATIQLSDDIFFDVRAAWGTSSNDQNTAGVTASFDTTRWLVAAQLSGDWHHEAWRVTPIASLRYGRERTDSYVTSAAVAVAANTTTVGRATFGPEIGYAHVDSEGTIWEPFVALHGIWDFAGDDTVTVGAVTDTLSDWRAEAELGLSTRWVGGAALRASLAYDGLGTDDLEAVSGRLWVNIPLN
jgi:outer membrane autotransporter protein